MGEDSGVEGRRDDAAERGRWPQELTRARKYCRDRAEEARRTDLFCGKVQGDAALGNPWKVGVG
jgi:hypothetical protein